MEQTVQNQSTFKLNYKRTFIIGFAFFGILLLWQVYDSWCTPILTELFKTKLGIADERKVQYLVGIMMAIDNLAALILLPIFGALSDKTKTRFGKRMPYIAVGTIVCCALFPLIPFFFTQSNLVGVIVIMAMVVLFAMMYRNPAVALMPDMTPKPLRSKANGIINIMGYIGGAFATVLGIFFDFKKKYLQVDDKNFWIVEVPFLVASVLMLISAIVLFILIKENKIHEEVKDEMARGDAVSETADKVDDDKPLSRANRIMLFLILGAEFFWFMADNAVGTFLNNYIIYNTDSGQAATSVLTIVGGVASVAGFALGGIIASKIGRKWTLFGGLG
ncbi:MAG: MFS transporter, partial [Bacilli bacterium]|nr:MFS transporter [Bacilli bacterium]